MRILHLYPDEMNLYGSYANLTVLTRQWEALGQSVTVIPVKAGDAVDFADFDLVYMGAGTERARDAVLARMQHFAKPLAEAVEAGLPLLFVGTALELLGQTITAPDGTVANGLGIAEFAVTQTATRIVGDVLGDSGLCGEPVVGFMNKCTHLTGVNTPLISACRLGFGNAAEKDGEGWRKGNAFGSELTGPLLVKNPALLRAVTETVWNYRAMPLPEVWPEEPYAAAGYVQTVQQLTLRANGG